MKTIKAIIFDWGDTLMRDFREYQGAMVTWPEVEMIPGTDQALQELHPHFICCVASNAGVSNASLMGQALERVGLGQYFHHLYTSQELGAAKPSAKFFQEIMRRTQIKPGECIMVGNDYTKDIAAAKAVGMYTILLAETLPEDLVPDADRVITSMSQLVDAVNDLVGE